MLDTSGPPGVVFTDNSIVNSLNSFCNYYSEVNKEL